MESVIIATPFPYDVEFKRRLEAIGPVLYGANGQLVLDDGKHRIYLGRNDALPLELEPERLRRIQSKVSTPRFYVLDFTDIGQCRKVLEGIADDPDLLIDDDHGTLLPGPEFVHLLRTKPTWDWRAE